MGSVGSEGASSRSSGSRNREPMHDARLRVQSGSSFSFQRVFPGKRRHAPSTITHASAEARLTSSKHHLASIRRLFALDSGTMLHQLRESRLATSPSGKLARDFSITPFPKTGPHLSFCRFVFKLSPGPQFAEFSPAHSKRKCLPASRALSHGCSWLFMAVHRLCPLFLLLLWPKH